MISAITLQGIQRILEIKPTKTPNDYKGDHSTYKNHTGNNSSLENAGKKPKSINTKMISWKSRARRLRNILNNVDITCVKREQLKRRFACCHGSVGMTFKQFMYGRMIDFRELLLEDNVHYLHQFVESRVDINVRDKEGLSCLHHALRHKEEKLEIVKYLVEHGADVNSLLPSKDSVIHSFPCLLEAARMHHFKICEFLISNGADVNWRSRVEPCMTIIQIAAIECNLRAVEFFDFINQVTFASKVSAFEITGSLFDTRYFMLRSWTNALKRRNHNVNGNETVHALKDSILPGVTKCNTVQSLPFFLENDEKRLFRAVHLLDRHFGRHHELTLNKLVTLAETYLKTEQGWMTGKTVIKYALCKVLLARQPILKCNRKVQCLYEILQFWLSYQLNTSGICFADINEIFMHLIGQLDILGNILPPETKTGLPESSLNLVYWVFEILFSFNKKSEEEETFNDTYEYLIKIESKFSHLFGNSVIHRGIQTRIDYSLSVKGKKYSLIKFLISNGLSINICDKNRNTPLHLVLKNSPNEESRDIVVYLLENGAHVDIRNKDRKTAMAYMRNYGITFSEVKYRSLQCLCAVVVKKNKIPFDGIVPEHVKSFIELH